MFSILGTQILTLFLSNQHENPEYEQNEKFSALKDFKTHLSKCSKEDVIDSILL